MTMEINARELRARRADMVKDAEKLVQAAELEDRDLTDDEQKQFDKKMDEANRLEARAKRLEEMSGLAEQLRTGKAFAHNKIKLGDTEERAWAHWLRTGDGGGLTDFRNSPHYAENRASNDTTMNITTGADGGYAVPTGHYQGIIARRDEGLLREKLGLMPIPGKGTTVNIPVDDEDDGEFVSTAESNAFDRDAPAIGQKQSTLVAYTKKVDLTYQLLEDEDSNIMAFLEKKVGDGMAKTHNNLILTEVAANGTSLKTFASATVIAVDELEPIVYDDTMEAYLDDSSNVSWVMRRSTHGEIVLLDDANTRRYANNQMGNEGGPSLLGFPINYSVKAGLTAASAKSVFFGNWSYVGHRDGTMFNVVRDPFTRAGYGEILLYYFFRTDYVTLQAEAIGYGVHPSA